MPNWTLEIDFDAFKDVASEFAALVAVVGPEAFPYYAAEAESISENAEILYKGYLLGKPLPNGKSVRKPAKEAAEGVVRKAAGVLQWDLINTAKQAESIEAGTPEWDMKLGLPGYKKARRAKDGTLYLVVPFRHGNPKAVTLNPMPNSVYKLAKQLSYSYHLGTVGTRVSASGHTVPVFGYAWGGKLPEGLVPKMKEHHKTDIFAQMYRFNGPKHTNYITFRTMSQKSDPKSWIRPATPGLFPLKTAIQVAMEEGMANLSAAVQADFMVMLGLAE